MIGLEAPSGPPVAALDGSSAERLPRSGASSLLARQEDPVGVGLLALCIQQDGLDKLLFKVKKRTAPGGTARSQTHRRGTRTRGVNVPLCGDNDSP